MRLCAALIVVWACLMSVGCSRQDNLFQGERVYTFTVNYDMTDEVPSEAAEAKALLKEFVVLPIVHDVLHCNTEVDYLAGTARVEASNAIKLVGDGTCVRMKDAILWNRASGPVEFMLHYTDGATVVSGNFSGAFARDGTLSGNFNAIAALVNVGQGTVESVRKVKNGEFSFVPGDTAPPSPGSSEVGQH